jgi:hypothetical protein
MGVSCPAQRCSCYIYAMSILLYETNICYTSYHQVILWGEMVMLKSTSFDLNLPNLTWQSTMVMLLMVMLTGIVINAKQTGRVMLPEMVTLNGNGYANFVYTLFVLTGSWTTCGLLINLLCEWANFRIHIVAVVELC